jgi:hypothetical protein
VDRIHQRLGQAVVAGEALCQELPPPPNDVPPLPALDPRQTTRTRLAQHARDPACGGCHRLIDPIGFGFEHFDAVGRYRETDRGLPIDARCEVLAAGGDDGPFTGTVELGARLAESRRVRQCLATEWLRYALGRRETAQDECTTAALADTLECTRSYREMLLALVESPAFLALPAAPPTR